MGGSGGNFLEENIFSSGWRLFLSGGFPRGKYLFFRLAAFFVGWFSSRKIAVVGGDLEDRDETVVEGGGGNFLEENIRLDRILTEKLFYFIWHEMSLS